MLDWRNGELQALPVDCRWKSPRQGNRDRLHNKINNGRVVKAFAALLVSHHSAAATSFLHLFVFFC